MGLDQLSSPERLRLENWIGARLGVTRIELVSIAPLTGGAIQENWLLQCAVFTGSHQSARKLVMRTDAPAAIDESRTREQEFALMSMAKAHAVKVPKPIGYCSDDSILGKPFAIMEYVEGTALGPKIVKDQRLGGNRSALTRELGQQLAMIHAIDPNQSELAFINTTRQAYAESEIESMRRWLVKHDINHPALEWGLRWALSHIPPVSQLVFLHRDFRTGNYLVNDSGLAAILDWEFAGYGDPMSDLGWFCAECWRFSRPDLEAGGIGTRAEFYQGYEEFSGRKVDHDSVLYWETMAHLRWAVIALQQGMRHLSGNEPSLNMAITSRIVDHLELLILRQSKPANWRNPKSVDPHTRYPQLAPAKQKDGVFDQSRGADLVAITRSTLVQEVLPILEGSPRFSGLMVNNALGILERELKLAKLRDQATENVLIAGQWQNLHAGADAIRRGAWDGSGNLHHLLLSLAVINAYIYQPAIPTTEEMKQACIASD